MQELDKMFNRQRKYIVYLLGIYVLGVVLTTYDTDLPRIDTWYNF